MACSIFLLCIFSMQKDCFYVVFTILYVRAIKVLSWLHWDRRCTLVSFSFDVKFISDVQERSSSRR